MTVDVWFDSQRLLCQLSSSDIGNSSSGNVSSGNVLSGLVLTFSDWGSPVHIAAPAPSDTISSGSNILGAL